MDESETRWWLETWLNVSRETLDQIDQFVTMLREESERQNLVSRTTLDSVGTRHIVDSAQLALLAGDRRDGHWLDLGTGAGFPGIVLAIVTKGRVTMVEERSKRHAWLSHVVDELGLDNARVIGRDLARVPTFDADIITARAFAPLGRLLDLAHRFSRADTLWLLPKGRSAEEELASVRDAWHGRFVLTPSVVDPSSAIIIATGVAPATGHVASTGSEHA